MTRTTPIGLLLFLSFVMTPPAVWAAPGGGAPTEASSLLLRLDATLTNERVLMAGLPDQLYWDDTNKRLGLDMPSPDAKFWIKNTAPTPGLYIQQGTSGTSLSGATFSGGGNQHSAISIFDALSVAADGAWGSGAFGLSIYHRKTGGTGNRTAFDTRMEVSSSASANNFFAGAQMIALAQLGATGQFFGANPYVQLKPGTLSTAQAIGMEVNTDVQIASPVAKTGIQIVDVGTSTGSGSYRNVGLRLLSQSGAARYSQGILFDADNATEPGIRPAVTTTGTLIGATAATYDRGLDFSALTFSTAALELKPGHKIRWTAAGGSVWSGATISGPQLILADNQVLAVHTLAGVEKWRIGTQNSGAVLSLAKATATAAATGAGYATLYWRSGTLAGTCKLVAIAGTSTVETLIVDNVGMGC